MSRYDDVIQLFLDFINTKNDNKDGIPVGISNRHIHLSQREVDLLFGEGYSLNKMKDLSQVGQYACKETLTICGPKGAIEKVRVLGPVRKQSQIEILSGDAFKLGIEGKIRVSGDLKDTSGITLIGPKGSCYLEEGVIVAQRHIHMNILDTKIYGVNDGDIVSIRLDGIRGGVYDNVLIRADENSVLECHIDIEESNAMGASGRSKIEIIK